MSGGRLVVFDWARVMVTLLVVHHHASLAYLGSEHRRWYVLDDPGTIVVDAIMRLAGPFVMPAFFLLAGYLTARSLRPPARPWRWLLDRLTRLGLPFVVGLFVLMPIPKYFHRLDQLELAEPGFVTYWWNTYLGHDIRAGHLWFLSFLLTIQLGAWAVASAWPHVYRPLPSRERRAARWSDLGIFVAVLTAGQWLALQSYGEYEWFEWGGTGIITFQPSRIAVYTMTFAVGIHGWRHQWTWTEDAPWARARVVLPAAALTAVALLTFSLLYFDHVADSAVLQAANALINAVSSVAWLGAVLVLSGVAARRWGRPPWLRRLSGASYSIYLLQMVIIVPVQYRLQPWFAPPLVKDLVVFSVALSGTYALTRLLFWASPPLGRLLRSG